MARKIFFARDWNKVGRNYFEVYSTVCMGYTFTIGQGIEGDPNFSVFYVTNDGRHDHYEILDVYITAGDSIEQVQEGVLAMLKKEMKIIIKRGLTTRLRSGMITVEQIERMAK